MKNRRLGRGLDFLLSGSEDTTHSKGDTELPLDQISSNPWQPRSDFDEQALEELTKSVRSHGVMQPVIVRPKGKEGGQFELVAGERRLLAARRAGLSTIPAIVREVLDGDMLTLALIENVQRSDLGPVERARAFRRLVTDRGLSHQEIADISGLARSTVSNCVRILELDEPVLQALSSRRITEGHARALLAESDAGKRLELFRRLLTEPLSVRAAEDSAAPTPKAGSKKRKFGGRGRSAEAAVLERRMSDALGLPMRIRERGSKGEVVIRYQSLEEFDRLFERVTGAKPDL